MTYCRSFRCLRPAQQWMTVGTTARGGCQAVIPAILSALFHSSGPNSHIFRLLSALFAGIAQRPPHADKRDHDAIRQSGLDPLQNGEPERAVQRLARQCRHQFQALETSGAGRLQAWGHQMRGDALPRPVWVYEKGADARWLMDGVKQSILTHFPLVPAI